MATPLSFAPETRVLATWWLRRAIKLHIKSINGAPEPPRGEDARLWSEAKWRSHAASEERELNFEPTECKKYILAHAMDLNDETVINKLMKNNLSIIFDGEGDIEDVARKNGIWGIEQEQISVVTDISYSEKPQSRNLFKKIMKMLSF